ncbi:Potassium transporter KimA [Planctomycetaceae bacterium]|nr:Potassium transporter KimA [Planctomycetaceae bacterium]
MLFSIGLLIVIAFLAYKASPVEKEEDAHVHGAGQIGLLAAVALFGVDYFTSYFYATGEMMHALHPYGIQEWGYYAAAAISIANIVFGALYMYSLGIFNEGGGSYTASMRYLTPGLSLVVAMVLIQDYIFTVVVSALSGGDQMLSILGLYGRNWVWHFLIGATLAAITWYLTIRGRGESARIVFILLGVFVMMTLIMVGGLIYANVTGVKPVEVAETIEHVSIGQALFHLLTASMKGLVALSGLEAMSNGIQFVINEDFSLVKWGKKHAPKFHKLWEFYSGKSGIGRMVQTSFLFYGGLTTFMLTFFAIRFNVFDGTLGRTLVGNLAYIGFTQLPGGNILFWVYQILAVALLAAASMTAFQDLQATGWRDVAIGEFPEFIVYRNAQGTFTRSVTIGFIITIVLMFLVRGKTTVAVPFYGVGVFMPIMMMGLAVRRHILEHYEGSKRKWGSIAASIAAALAAIVFVGQIVGKWEEGGWMVLISFSVLILAANAMLISPGGRRDPKQIHRIVREKARVQGAMASIVEWQSLKMQEYRYSVLLAVTNFFGMLGVRRPVRFDPPVPAGDYDHALHVDHPEAPSLLDQYLDKPKPKLGGSPKQTTPVPHNGD